uniref:Uncharacterized protein n=1 Tax=Panagrolaimus sp. ES5 TaxID=591445 RepID=A0AC34F5J8_9BILA
MSEDNNINVKASYDKFVRSFTKYANPNKPIKDLATIRSEIQDILKTHRPIRFGDYQFGFSKSKTKISNYSGANVWKCCECNRTTSNESDTSDLIIAHGMVFVKNGHACKPRNFSFVQEIQKLYKEKNIDEAVALQKSVLGSEDLNVVCKQKTANNAGKRGAKGVKGISELNLQFLQHQSNMDESIDEIQEILSPEASFANIIENLKDYTNEKAEVVMSHKLYLLRILKTHYPVKIGNFVFGLSENLQKNKHIIVFEWNDRKRVREYTKKSDCKNLWRCRECFRLHRGKAHSNCYLSFVNGIVFVPYIHDCKPLSYELIMHYQKYLEEGDITSAKRMTHTVSFVYGEWNYANIVNVLDTVTAPVTTVTEEEVNENNLKTLTNLKRKNKFYDGNVSASSAEKPLCRKKSKPNKSALDDTVADGDDSILFVQEFPVHKKPKFEKNTSGAPKDDTYESSVDNQSSIFDKPQKNSAVKESDPLFLQNFKTAAFEMEEVEPESTAPTSVFVLEKPSTLMLQEICAKLKIEYSSRAEKMWDQIMFKRIDTVTPPKQILIHHLKTQNFYQILSKLFIGKIYQHRKIKDTLIDAFRQKLISSGGDISSTKMFIRMYSDTVTYQDLSFLAKYLSCRILIFEGSKIRKYGNWKNASSERATLVVALIDGFYSIVLDF